MNSCLERGNGVLPQKPHIKLEKLFWSEESPGKFTSILSLHEQEISSILNAADTQENIIGMFQKLVENVITEGDFKKKKSKPQNDAPWFDESCRLSRESVTTLGKSLKNDPSNQEIRKILFENKKKFRKLTREKKEILLKHSLIKCFNLNVLMKVKNFGTP